MKESNENAYPSDDRVDVSDYRGSSGLKGMVENPYVLATALFASLGGVLFGYDQGVISGIQEMETFKARFDMSTTENAFVVAILTLGCWVGALIVGYFADKIGRKYSIVLNGIVFLIGSSFQGGAQTVPYLMAGRFVAGLSIGGLSMLVPLYQSEIAPPEIRGSLVSLQQLAVTFGILISFWIDYGCQNIPSEAQWRVPFCIQIALGLLLVIGIFFFPFSPRWLMAQGRDDEALQVLSKLRRVPINHPRVQEEYRDIKVTVIFEQRVEAQRFPDLSNGTTMDQFKIGCYGYLDLFKAGMFKRLFIACALQFFQQFSGINAIIYYAPKIMKSLGLTGNSVSLLATGVIGIINFLCTFITVLYLDKFGRKKFLLTASVCLTLCMVIVAAIVGVYEDDWPNHIAQGWVSVAFIYFYIANFAYSFGPLGWVIPSEIFPLRVRSKAMSISTSANWMCNFIIGLITPIMLDSIRFYTYVFFAIFCFISFFFVFFMIPETKGRSLEDMDAVFGGQTAAEDTAILDQVKTEVYGQQSATKPSSTQLQYEKEEF
ncbi:general substrate transporter [Halteromyces radiatus]|uniref:general substrate transporter n=1 Tax=Halteromyces radiatus TaxID=101107 RepID=UPI00221F1687|nr:general substrate transporter [Halteromyces radiatus]KAI8086109.1 general substrate transporter [Halteromyces radiatus]